MTIIRVKELHYVYSTTDGDTFHLDKNSFGRISYLIKEKNNGTNTMKGSKMFRVIPLVKMITFVVLSRLIIIGCSGSTNQPTPNIKEIQSGFITPRDSNNLWCYWYWINDDISKEGITKDLEAMKQAGIGAAFIGNINPPEVDGPVPLLSEKWWECMVHAVNEGKRIGVDIGSFNCPGWSQSGGPWVKSEMAMRYLTYSEVTIKGPGKVSVQLPQPNKEFMDTHVLAFPALKIEKNKLTLFNSEISVTPPMDGVKNLLDSDTSTVFLFDVDEKGYTIDLKSEKQINAKSLVLKPAKRAFEIECELQALLGGQYVSVKSFAIDRRNTSVSVGAERFAPIAISLPNTPSNLFRLIIKNPSNRIQQVGFSEIIISEAAILEQYVEKHLGKMHPTPFPAWGSYLWKAQEEVADKHLKVAAGDVLDISDKMDASGLLTWEVPEGEWTVLRFGMTPTGTKNSPAAPQGKGYEIDKANRELIRFHFQHYIGEFLKRIPQKSKSAFKYVIADSYEMGSQNWTDNFEQKFEKKFGYYPVKYLPLFSGRIVNSVEESERFLWDLRRWVADAVAHEYVGGLREISQEHHLNLWLENYGHWGFPSEFLMYGGQSDLVSGEFWNEGSLGNIECKAASSAAHIYGKPITSAEAFTASGNTFGRYPAMLKKRGDWSFTEGINHLVLHVNIHQPDDKRKPGINAWFSTEFNRHNTWFKEAKSYFDYLRRCQHMLQQGKYVADVCYFIGENAPVMTGVRDPELPQGYSFDYINAEVILNRLEVENDRFVLPDGTSYRVMVLPPLKTMRPEVLQKIERLVKQGGVVVGPKPEKSPSLQNYPECDRKVELLADKLWAAPIENGKRLQHYGKGFVAEGFELSELFDQIDLTKDLDIGDDQPVLWTHRSMPGLHIYFLTNQSNVEINIVPDFRVQGMKPQLWDAIAGSIRDLPAFQEHDGVTTVPLKLQALQSAFIVFEKESREPADVGVEANFPQPQTIASVSDPWSVTFDVSQRGPVKPVEMKELYDWTIASNDSIKYYSGTAVYQNHFELPELPAQSVFLNLGEASALATVRVNGLEVGGIWIAPWTVDISDAVKAGKNSVEISVVNTWANRLIGDSRLPQKERQTWCLINPFTPDSDLFPAGLLGPVTVQTVK